MLLHDFESIKNTLIPNFCEVASKMDVLKAAVSLVVAVGMHPSDCDVASVSNRAE
jgi:hypothetical protein